MNIPDTIVYKDFHGDIEIPRVSMETLQTYLATVDKTLDEKAKNLYKEQFLLCICIAKTDDIYIKARCAAETSKRVVYEIDISLDKDGVILECQCNCGAGMGPSAHRKHVCAVIIGLIDFSENKQYKSSCFLYK